VVRRGRACVGVLPVRGVVVALIAAVIFRARWKLFVGLAVALTVVTLLFFPAGGSGVGSSGLIG
jgi:hypothetical protein